MSQLTVYVPSTGRVIDRRPGPSSRLVAALATDTGIKLELPFAPVEASLGPLAGRWDEVARTGRTPLVRYRGGNLPTLEFDVILARLDGSPVDDLIDTLTQIASGAHRVTISGLSAREVGPWRLRSCAVKIAQRTPDNGPREALASLAFVAVSDATVAASPLPTATGPLTGGAAGPPAAPPSHPYTPIRRPATSRSAWCGRYSKAAGRSPWWARTSSCPRW